MSKFLILNWLFLSVLCTTNLQVGLNLLHILHQRGVSYRDLKPENVIISESSHFKLVDFSFAWELEVGPSKAAEIADFLYELKHTLQHNLYHKKKEIISATNFQQVQIIFRHFSIDCLTILKEIGDIDFIFLIAKLLTIEKHSEFETNIILENNERMGTKFISHIGKRYIEIIFVRFQRVIWKFLAKSDLEDSLPSESVISSKRKIVEAILSLLSSLDHNVKEMCNVFFGLSLSPKEYIEVMTMLIDEINVNCHLQIVNIYIQLDTFVKQHNGEMPTQGYQKRKGILLCLLLIYYSNQIFHHGPFVGEPVEIILGMPKLLAIIFKIVIRPTILDSINCFSDKEIIKMPLEIFHLNEEIKGIVGKGVALNKVSYSIDSRISKDRARWINEAYSILYQHKNEY